MDTLRCPRCWKQLPGHSMFCSRCGSRLPAAAPTRGRCARSKGRVPWVLFVVIGMMIFASHRSARRHPPAWSPSPSAVRWAPPQPQMDSDGPKSGHPYHYQANRRWSTPNFEFEIRGDRARFNDTRWRLENKQGVGCETDALPRE